MMTRKLMKIEMENINNMIDIKNNIINNNYSDESEILLKNVLIVILKVKNFLNAVKHMILDVL